MRAIAGSVWQLPLVPRNGINAYVIGDVLVDTGIKQSAGKIAGMLEGRSISAIALTHAHGDHAGAMKRLAARFGVPVWCGAADREAAETGRLVLSPTLDRPRASTVANAVAGSMARPSPAHWPRATRSPQGSPSSTRRATPRATSRSGARRTAR